MNNDEQLFEDYESAISALEKLSEESALSCENWRRLEHRSFTWGSPGFVTITDTVKTQESHVFGYKEYETYTYNIQVKFEGLTDEIKAQLLNSPTTTA